MRLLLDTSVVIWWLSVDQRLAPTARTAIGASDSEVFVSAATAWEISIKQALRKLDAPSDLEAQIAHHRFSPLSMTVSHAIAAGSLPLYHKDPFDRMLIAQAVAEGLILVTADAQIMQYNVPTMPATDA